MATTPVSMPSTSAEVTCHNGSSGAPWHSASRRANTRAMSSRLLGPWSSRSNPARACCSRWRHWRNCSCRSGVARWARACSGNGSIDSSCGLNRLVSDSRLSPRALRRSLSSGSTTSGKSRRALCTRSRYSGSWPRACCSSRIPSSRWPTCPACSARASSSISSASSAAP
ncbi:hypothetical protein PFLmoz3_01562 [Pseudomonas fluorescens]|uniref:Uncharacterized protein n=1 Tax=Pseudomonas fluorescens TaxID=294 RepID=A0A109LIS3_PSEFL|nr:hypothetical protein PFLmoz3_01562 [Pseudomonas fluorescens]